MAAFTASRCPPPPPAPPLPLYTFPPLFLTEVFLPIMHSDILCLKDTGFQPAACTASSQPFNGDDKRTFLWHKSPYVGFVAIRLSRKASKPNKRGLGEMYCLAFYVKCDTATCGGISKESDRLWIGQGRRTNP